MIGSRVRRKSRESYSPTGFLPVGILQDNAFKGTMFPGRFTTPIEVAAI